MGEDTKIEWADATINPWWGCTKISPACTNCYAATFAARWGQKWGPGAPRPLKRGWRSTARKLQRQAERERRRLRVFALSMGDWLDEEAPPGALAELLEVIASTPDLDWLLLTKRPERWAEAIGAAVAFDDPSGDRDPPPGACLAADWLSGTAPTNVWLGTTVEDQRRANERIPALLDIPARIRFLSCEPLLEQVDLSRWLLCNSASEDGAPSPRQGVDWVICGGESGRGARPMHPDWVRSLRDQCELAVVPFFLKQWGEWAPFYDRDRDDPDWRNVPEEVRGRVIRMNLAGGAGFHGDALVYFERVGKKAAGRELDGRTWDESPVLSARQRILRPVTLEEEDSCEGCGLVRPLAELLVCEDREGFEVWLCAECAAENQPKKEEGPDGDDL